MGSSNIYLFNPTCEYAVANGNESWQPNRILQTMESDLATLPMFFANLNDIILVDRLPSKEFLKQFDKIQLPLPQFILKKEILKNRKIKDYTFNKLLPWGWSPAAHKLLSSLKMHCSKEFQNSPVAFWNPEHKYLYSKGFGLKILNELVSAYESEVFIPEELIPEICTTKDHIKKLISRWGRLMVKAPWSSSGRGLQPITKTPVHPKVWEKILGIINEQGYAVVEPLLNKAGDLAFQFELKKGSISFIGISSFSADQKGQYQGNFLNGLPENYSTEIQNFMMEVPKIVLPKLIKILESSELSKLYEGNFGVDTLIFYDENNQLKLNPCLEINVRQNMGLLSLQLEKFINHDRKGVFRTWYNPDKPFLSLKNEMEKIYPLKISSHKIESGFFPLTEAFNNTLFGAYILI